MRLLVFGRLKTRNASCSLLVSLRLHLLPTGVVCTPNKKDSLVAFDNNSSWR